ncbi:hypothetical protein [Lentzea albida]|uniref:Uncharacterized protein n=1 Tax=Lentzea albida TaxID=65499 RepID=A0A1H9MPN3_9PSEU|nr:hypothetical protein [Lentzea albida]SER25670.1 hypothetical protein SAMN04488000_107153 [Lentzea albida]
MNDHEPAAGDVAWQPFVDALCAAASTWDADLGRFPEEDRPAPISPEQAENVMLALAALAQRMSKATAAVVRAMADEGLEPAAAGDDLTDQLESLARMALCAEAMERAAELARGVVSHDV